MAEINSAGRSVRSRYSGGEEEEGELRSNRSSSKTREGCKQGIIRRLNC